MNLSPLKIIEMLMQVLADRALVMLTLLLKFGLFAWAIYQPSELRIATATIFSVTVFIPILRTERKNNTKQIFEEREAA